MRALPARSGVVALLLLAAAAWALSAVRMDGMDAGPASHLGSLGWYAATWLLMMAAMMLPSLVPTLPARARADAPFVGGYLLAWAAAGLVAYALIEAVRELEPGFLGWDETGRYVAGGVILAAALYELSPWKHACLRRCRAPLAGTPREPSSAGGALRRGVEYGMACVGCCWALMAALFALGAMSLVWMAVVGAVVAVEKLLPWRPLTRGGIVLLLALLGASVAFAPGDLPGFTEPDTAPLHHDMGGMD